MMQTTTTAAAPTTSVRVRLSKPQARAHRALRRHSTVVIPWGRGVGKSYFTRLMWWLLAAEWDGKRIPGAPHTGIRIVHLMPTLEQSRKVHEHLTISELEGDWAFLGGKLNRSDWRIRFPGGSWIQWVSAERAVNIRGLRCDFIDADECDAIEVSTYDAVAQPWLSEPFSLAMQLLGGTPERGRYGLLYRKHRQALDGAPNTHSFHATYEDVPEHVDVPRINAQVRPFTEPSLFAREWLCDFDAAEGLVYPMFSEDFHRRVPHHDTRWDEVLIGVDHGYEDAGVFVMVGIAGHGRDATCHVIEEVYEQHRTESWWLERAKKARQDYPRAKWFADPSQPARIESMRRLGLNIRGADNAIDDGVSAVADRLVIRRPEGGKPFTRLFIDPKCANTVRELGLYRRKRDPRNKDRVLDTIEDKNNHAMDALRYAVFGRFGKPPGIRLPQPDDAFTFG